MSDDLINEIKAARDWVAQVKKIEILYESTNRPSIRILAKQLDISKSAMALELKLIRGLRVYPEIAKEPNKFAALKILRRKERLRKFLGE